MSEVEGPELAVLIANERTKLRATFLNALAIAIFAVGTVAPVVSAATSSTTPGKTLVVLAAVCIVLGFAIQPFAMKSLEALRA